MYKSKQNQSLLFASIHVPLANSTYIHKIHEMHMKNQFQSIYIGAHTGTATAAQKFCHLC